VFCGPVSPHTVKRAIHLLAHLIIRWSHKTALVCEFVQCGRRGDFEEPMRSLKEAFLSESWLGAGSCNVAGILVLVALTTASACWPVLLKTNRRRLICFYRERHWTVRRLCVGCAFAMLTLVLAAVEPNNWPVWIICFGFFLEIAVTIRRAHSICQNGVESASELTRECRPPFEMTPNSNVASLKMSAVVAETNWAYASHLPCRPRTVPQRCRRRERLD
jgi:hypothetical protein